MSNLINPCLAELILGDLKLCSYFFSFLSTELAQFKSLLVEGLVLFQIIANTMVADALATQEALAWIRTWHQTNSKPYFLNEKWPSSLTYLSQGKNSCEYPKYARVVLSNHKCDEKKYQDGRNSMNVKYVQDEQILRKPSLLMIPDKSSRG